MYWICVKVWALWYAFLINFFDEYEDYLFLCQAAFLNHCVVFCVHFVRKSEKNVSIFCDSCGNFDNCDYFSKNLIFAGIREWNNIILFWNSLNGFYNRAVTITSYFSSISTFEKKELSNWASFYIRISWLIPAYWRVFPSESSGAFFYSNFALLAIFFSNFISHIFRCRTFS